MDFFVVKLRNGLRNVALTSERRPEVAAVPTPESLALAARAADGERAAAERLLALPDLGLAEGTVETLQSFVGSIE